MLPFVGFSFVGESNPPNQMIHLVVRCVSPMLGGFPRVRHLVSADALIRATKRSCLEFVCSAEIRFSVSGYSSTHSEMLPRDFVRQLDISGFVLFELLLLSLLGNFEFVE